MAHCNKLSHCILDFWENWRSNSGQVFALFTCTEKKAACKARAIRFTCKHWQVATQRKTGRQAGTFAALRMLLPVLARGLLSAGNAGSGFNQHTAPTGKTIPS
jgi:hypothetical protein